MATLINNNCFFLGGFLDGWEAGSTVGAMCPFISDIKYNYGGLRCHVRILFIIKHNIKQLKSQPARQRNNIISVVSTSKKYIFQVLQVVSVTIRVLFRK